MAGPMEARANLVPSHPALPLCRGREALPTVYRARSWGIRMQSEWVGRVSEAYPATPGTGPMADCAALHLPCGYKEDQRCPTIRAGSIARRGPPGAIGGR